MPLYDYQCRACSTVTEVRHGFREVHEGRCPACGGEMARVFNPAGIVFKGSGFYINDSRPAASSGSSGESSAPAAPAADGGAKKADAPKKPDGPKKSDTAA